MARLNSTRLDNVTIKPRRIPYRANRTPARGKTMIADYVLTSCALCDTEIAMTVPFDGKPVYCAAHDHPSSDRYSFSEAVLAIEDDEDDVITSQYDDDRPDSDLYAWYWSDDEEELILDCE